MTSLQLQALGLPPSCANVDDDVAFQTLFRQLEEECFHQAYGSSRNFLYSQDPAEFLKALPDYLDLLGCPKAWINSDRRKVRDFVLELAVNKSYDVEGASNVKAVDVEIFQNDISKLNAIEEELKKTIQINSPEFRNQLKDILTSVGLGNIDHPDTSLLLKALVVFIENGTENAQLSTDSKFLLNLDDLPMDKSAGGDQDLDHALKILHLLNVSQFRQLQTRINELIVEVQKVTADPKADLNLGKLGF